MEQDDPDQDPGLAVDAETAERLQREMRCEESTPAGPKSSLTDPDARFLRERGGRFRLGYSGELAVSDDHFIVAVRVTSRPRITLSLLPMVQAVEGQCGARPQQVLADSGFYSGDNLDVLRSEASTAMYRIRIWHANSTWASRRRSIGLHNAKPRTTDATEVTHAGRTTDLFGESPWWNR